MPVDGFERGVSCSRGAAQVRSVHAAESVGNLVGWEVGYGEPEVVEGDASCCVEQDLTLADSMHEFFLGHHILLETA